MNAFAHPPAPGAARRFAGLLVLLAFSMAAVHRCPAAPSFVYETSGEFLASGDFNGDGILDVLVVDKITGNARVGYADASGNLTWSAPLVTGVGQATGCGVGRWLQTTRDVVAMTAPTLNRVNLVDLSGTNTAGTPVAVTPLGLGPHTVVPLADPSGGAPPAYNDLLIASSDNAGSAELLDLMGISAGAATEAGQFSENGPYDRGNALQLSVTPATFAVGLVRGSNDVLDIWQFTNHPAVMLSYSNLPPGSDYTFGLFNSETLPRFLFYEPGGTNITIVALEQSAGQFTFGPPAVVSVSDPIQGVYYQTLATGGSALILFSNGVQGLTLPGGVPLLGSLYGSGAGASGNVFTGVVPLGPGVLALLDAPPGGLSSVHGQVLRFSGATYSLLSSANLPQTTSRTTRANVWLFETEPLVDRGAEFVASFSTPDWSDSVSGLASALTVTTQTDGGPSTGLGAVGTNNLSAPPPGSNFGVPNQYNQAISLFSYASPQSTAQPVTVTISPTPGIYDGPIQVSFSALPAAGRVLYRVGPADSWHAYTSAVTLSNDNTILYYGTNSSLAARSQLQSATYSLGINGQPTPTVNLGTGGSSSNPPPSVVAPTNVVLSPVGTVFYGRRSTTGVGSIWAINYDGSDDTYITAGVRPRVSRNGQWMAFLREGSPFQNRGNIWLRNLQTSQEYRLFVNTGIIVCYDWRPDGSGLVMDYNCGIWSLGTNGVSTELLPTDCYEQAPAIHPVDGRIAFQDLSTGSSAAGLYVAPPNGSNASQIVTATAAPGASWPAWSPDGLDLAFVDDNNYSSVDLGTNLWVVAPDGSSLNRICDFAGTTNHFPHGAIWSPDGTALVGAGALTGTNGLWIIPLNPDRSDCQGGPTLLPTTPGDAIDFAGSIVASQPVPGLSQLAIQRGTNHTFTVVWSTNFASFTLESSPSLNPPVTWTPIAGPYLVSGINFLYLDPINPTAQGKFYRLAANAPQLIVQVGAGALTLSWNTNFPGYTLQTTATLSPNTTWASITGPYPVTGVTFQFTEPLSALTPPAFFRLNNNP